MILPDHGQDTIYRTWVRRAYGLTLINCRRQIGISQEWLGLETGVDRAYMSRLERGKHTPTLVIILRFLPILKVSFSEFAAEFDKCLRQVKREAGKEKKDNR